jgi:hypothetical protein
MKSSEIVWDVVQWRQFATAYCFKQGTFIWILLRETSNTSGHRIPQGNRWFQGVGMGGPRNP